MSKHVLKHVSRLGTSATRLLTNQKPPIFSLHSSYTQVRYASSIPDPSITTGWTPDQTMPQTEHVNPGGIVLSSLDGGYHSLYPARFEIARQCNDESTKVHETIDVTQLGLSEITSDASKLIPASPNAPLTWYMCGPTVYDHAHIGHARTYVCLDIIHRIVSDIWRKPISVAMGVTDIDDKIIASANKLGVDWRILARRYEDSFLEDMRMLGVRTPSAILRVSEHIPAIIDFINRVVQKDLAYQLDSGIYFDVHEFERRGYRYGKLKFSLNNKHEVAAAAASSASDMASDVALHPGNTEARSQGTSLGDVKRNPSDFALWKVSKPNEPGWDSPWGQGRPGWHIECSAMTAALFGGALDVHAGGIDLKFPHHCNEIAQCEAMYGWGRDVRGNASKAEGIDNKDDDVTVVMKHMSPIEGYSSATTTEDNNNSVSTWSSSNNEWCRVWIHTGHVHIDGLKMSKSLKNFITVRQLFGQQQSTTTTPSPTNDVYTPDAFRLFCLQSHYRSAVDYSTERMNGATAILRKLYLFFEYVRTHHERYLGEVYPIHQTICSLIDKDPSVDDATRSTLVNPLCSDASQLVVSQLPPHRWSGAEHSLNTRYFEIQSTVDRALKSDFDTPAALNALLALTNDVKLYIQQYMTLSPPVLSSSSPSSPSLTGIHLIRFPLVVTICEYIQRTFALLGFRFASGRPLYLAPEHAAQALTDRFGSLNRGASGGDEDNAQLDMAMRQFAAFRAAVKKVALSNAPNKKQLKQAKSTLASTSAVTASDGSTTKGPNAIVEGEMTKAEADAIIRLKKQIDAIMLLCDEARDETFAKLGYTLADTISSGSSVGGGGAATEFTLNRRRPGDGIRANPMKSSEAEPVTKCN